MTLDEIEKTILPEFNEPRLSLALGRGAVGSGRLRSEAYTAARLPEQLEDIQSEFVTKQRLLKVDRAAGVVSTTRDPELARGGVRRGVWQTRRASGLPRDLQSNARSLPSSCRTCCRSKKSSSTENKFKVTFQEFDWRLNDLTGGRIE